MGCRSSSLHYTTRDFKLARSGVDKYDAWFAEVEGIIAAVMSAHAKIVQAFDNFVVHTGSNASHDYQMCHGMLAIVCSAIAVTEGNVQEVGLRLSDKMPGIFMEVSKYPKLQDALIAWGGFCEALIEGLAVVRDMKFRLCDALKWTRLTPDYLLKDAFDNGTDISTFRTQESVAEENDRVLQQANGIFQDLALTIIETAQEADYTIQGLSAFDDYPRLWRIVKKVENTPSAQPHLILQVLLPDLNPLVKEYKDRAGIPDISSR